MGICEFCTASNAGMVYAAVLLGAFYFVPCVGACDLGPACHYGDDYDQLTLFLLNRATPTITNSSCHSQQCQDRRIKVLLSHPPVGCGTEVNIKWRELLAECGTFQGRCCPTCTRQTTAHCDESYKSDDTVFATAYTVLVTILLLVKFS